MPFNVAVTWIFQALKSENNFEFFFVEEDFSHIKTVKPFSGEKKVLWRYYYLKKIFWELLSSKALLLIQPPSKENSWLRLSSKIESSISTNKNPT